MNPLTYYLVPSTTETRKLYTRDFRDICRSGNIQKLREYSSIQIKGMIGNYDYGIILETYELGHMEIVEFLYMPDREFSDKVFFVMCCDGHTEIVRHMLQNTRLGEDFKINYGFNEACRCGHIEIVRLLLQDNRITDVKRGFNSACYGGHIEIVRFLIQDERVTNLGEGFTGACRGGHIEIVRLLLQDNRITYLGEGFDEACGYGHIEIVRLLLQDARLSNTSIINGLGEACIESGMSTINIIINHITAHPEILSA